MAEKDLPSELEYVSDFSAQENFRRSFKLQLDRCLILMIREPHGPFELALNGLDIMLDYYKDETYLTDMDEIAYDFKNELFELRKEQRKGSNISSRAKNARYTNNTQRFRALMRLAGRASFLPFPPIAIKVGGKNPELEYKEVEYLKDEEIEEISKQVDENLKESMELEGKTVEDLRKKDLKEEEEVVSTATKRSTRETPRTLDKNKDTDA